MKRSTKFLLAFIFFSLGVEPYATAQRITLLDAPTITFPSETDSNSPAFWWNRNLVVYNSTGMGPVRSTGPNQRRLVDSGAVNLGSAPGPAWIEATWTDPDGTVFAWYHHEPGGLCGNSRITAPTIGALVSYDSGQTFYNLGIVLQNGFGIDCYSPNGYFGGGNGDFSVVMGPAGRYFYFLFSNYGGPLAEQGVAVARMPVGDRLHPVGAIQKYYAGKWEEPGIGGHVTPILPAKISWQEPGTDAFWGPSVHWNNYLNKYVMLLNHSCCSPGWPQEGVYAAFSPSPANPLSWTAPDKIVDGVGWYPQVIGNAPDGTDKLAGHTARFYVSGSSSREIVFDREEPTSQTPNPAGSAFRF